MSFDKATRNALARMVGTCRTRLTEDIRQQLQQVYGLQPDGSALPVDRLTHLDDEGRETATGLREWQEHLAASEIGIEAYRRAAAFERMAHEIAFTLLNRLAALRMCEERGLIIECVRRGMESDGFAMFERLSGGMLGARGEAYNAFLRHLFDELAVDLGPLFDRRHPHSLVLPDDQCLEKVLAHLNDKDLATLWKEDETIGWIYQYYNDDAERKKIREESAAPRNSRELAVRNQFFTPRYVVEFLTDNTLGRIWYEMNRSQTRLKDQCRYLVRRPNEIFLQPGETAPEQPQQENLSQEQLLQQPVFIPHRPLKDPREIRMLDPACGSMHFGLYAFDLFEVIYDEAWDLAHGSDEARKSSAAYPPFVSFVAEYPDKAAFLADVPRLIIEHNLHGIDIDPRAAQIAGLSLWLRAQRTWQQQGRHPQNRPRIRRSNIVCAEPMPGEEAFLDEFIEAHLSATLEHKLLGQLVRHVFGAMKLAGEAGSLLKIEEEISNAVKEAQEAWRKVIAKSLELFGPAELNRTLRPGTQQELVGLEFAVSELARDHRPSTTDFWEKAEERIYAALQAYAEQAEDGGGYQRRLFADDTARGFAFIDLCRQRYDVALMNPPFGEASLPSKPYLDDTYGDTKGDVYKAFVECFQARLVPAGYLGIISSRTGFFLGQSEDWRTRVLLRLFRPIALADLGSGVLDAMVEVAAYVLRSLSAHEASDLTLSLVPVLGRVALDRQERFSLPKWQVARDGLKRHQALAELEQLEVAGFIERRPGEIVRYTPVWPMVKAVSEPPQPVFPPLTCIRLLTEEDKGAALANTVEALVVGRATPMVFVVAPADFRQVPGAPFSYWAGNHARRTFSTFPALQAGGRKACFGLSTKDDFRFVRLGWEIDCSGMGRRWYSFVKGGAFARFYSDPHLVLDWEENGRRLKAFADHRTAEIFGVASWSRWINNWDTYFRAGINWSRRSQRGLSLRAFPAGCIFSDKAPVIFDEIERLSALLAVTNSLPFLGLVELQMAFGSYEVGVLQRTPIPTLSKELAVALGSLARRAWSEKRSLDTAESTSHAFVVPAMVAVPGGTLVERAAVWAVLVRTSEQRVTAIQAEIDDLAFHLYGLDGEDRAALIATLAMETGIEVEAEASEGEEEEATTADVSTLTADLLSHALGTAFGRWDIRFATGEKPAPELPDPFAPLPVCPPGQLQCEQGLPISKEDVGKLKEGSRWNYPIEIPWDGILVDDPGHPLDLEVRVHQVLQVIWKERWEAIEREACEILGVRALRDYFRKPAGFFADHLKRYSKSRRQAPIYWPLSTTSGSYTLWVYYHRLNEDLLFRVVNEFVNPKIAEISREIAEHESQLGGASGREATALRGKLEEAKVFRGELEDLKAELLRVAGLPYKPDLNDGVLITASPLWKLFRLPKWRKDLEACWKKLETGEYDWAHLAYAIWPDRVKEACRRDRSIAIAHGLEELYEGDAPASAKKARRTRKT